MSNTSRTKGEVWALGDDPATWGQETADGLSNITGREKSVLFDSGYWFRAYDWSNYLFACTVCNSRWKLSYFPRQAGRPSDAPDPRSEIGMQPLLLNCCFDDEAPWKHFRFNPARPDREDHRARLRDDPHVRTRSRDATRGPSSCRAGRI